MTEMEMLKELRNVVASIAGQAGGNREAVKAEIRQELVSAVKERFGLGICRGIHDGPGIHTKRGGEFRRAQRLHNQGLAESIIMCTTDQTCDCWDNGYAHCLEQLKTWASGTHGRNCDCDGCVVAVIILKNALRRVGTILDELQETPPEPPKPSDQFNAGGAADF